MVQTGIQKKKTFDRIELDELVGQYDERSHLLSGNCFDDLPQLGNRTE